MTNSQRFCFGPSWIVRGVGEVLMGDCESLSIEPAAGGFMPIAPWLETVQFAAESEEAQQDAVASTAQQGLAAERGKKNGGGGGS